MDGDSSRDGAAMDRALALGRSVRRATAPNPWVGCVVVRAGEVVAEGATSPPGGDHAEIVALRAAGTRARGATVVVTLEPCAHDGRTGPCAEALVAAGVARVVVALEDPDPQVAGRGLARLRAAGVEVRLGVGAARAEEDLGAYLHQRRTGRARCVAKAATSLDGCLAAADGSSRWITGPEARADAHSRRADAQAIVVGAGTALVDRPTLTVRDLGDGPAPEHPPLRVLLDARGRVPARGPLFDSTLAPTLVLTTDAAPQAATSAWRGAGAEVEVVAAATGGVDLRAALAALGGRGVLDALVEGGAAIHGSLLAAGLVDRIVAYVAGTLLGANGRPAWGIAGPTSIDGAERWRLVEARRLGGDVRLDYVPAQPGQQGHVEEAA